MKGFFLNSEDFYVYSFVSYPHCDVIDDLTAKLVSTTALQAVRTSIVRSLHLVLSHLMAHLITLDLVVGLLPA